MEGCHVYYTRNRYALQQSVHPSTLILGISAYIRSNVNVEEDYIEVKFNTSKIW
jgi:hypothetical protein